MNNETQIRYSTSLGDAGAEAREGFFVGWPNPPSHKTLSRLLEASDHIVLALDGGKLVGYATALSDGVLFSSITSIEVLPEYQAQGIGRELLNQVLAQLSELYATDLVCDEDVIPFYEKAGMIRLSGMGIRRRDRITPS